MFIADLIRPDKLSNSCLQNTSVHINPLDYCALLYFLLHISWTTTDLQPLHGNKGCFSLAFNKKGIQKKTGMREISENDNSRVRPWHKFTINYRKTVDGHKMSKM